MQLWDNATIEKKLRNNKTQLQEKNAIVRQSHNCEKQSQLREVKLQLGNKNSQLWEVVDKLQLLLQRNKVTILKYEVDYKK